MKNYVVVRDGNRFKVAKLMIGREGYSVLAVATSEGSADMIVAALEGAVKGEEFLETAVGDHPHAERAKRERRFKVA